MFKKITLEKTIYFFVLIVMIGLPLLKLFSYIPFFNNINDFLMIKRVYLLWIFIFLFLISYLYGIISKETKICYIDIVVYILIILAFISTGLSVNFEKSFFGETLRYEGLLTLLSYYLIVLNVKSIKTEKYKKNIVKVFIILGIFQSVYAILQTYTNLSFIRRYPITYMGMGLCSNPNFFGSYMVMQSLLVSTLYILNNQNRYLFLSVLFTASLYLASSTGPLLGFSIAFIFLSVICRKKIKNILKLFLILLITCFIIDFTIKYTQEDVYKKTIMPDYNISKEIVNNLDYLNKNNLEKIGNGRIKLWIRSFPLVEKYWLTGSGLDTFADVYPQTNYIRFDKAHNVYLQIAITNGVPALLTYLFLCFIAFIKGLKFKDSYMIALYIAFIGYSIQAFANISAIDVAPYFYIVIGLLLENKSIVKT